MVDGEEGLHEKGTKLSLQSKGFAYSSIIQPNRPFISCEGRTYLVSRLTLSNNRALKRGAGVEAGMSSTFCLSWLFQRRNALSVMWSDIVAIQVRHKTTICDEHESRCKPSATNPAVEGA